MVECPEGDVERSRVGIAEGDRGDVVGPGEVDDVDRQDDGRRQHSAEEGES